MADVTVRRTIAADPQRLYDLVSDVTRMGEWSPENTGGRWLGSATGAAPGVKFRGSNRDGWRRWATTCTVTDADPGNRFGFDVHLGPLPVAHWEYEIAPDSNGGSVVTESWRDLRARWMVKASPAVMGISDRAAHNRQGMEVTLERLGAAAERT